MANLILSTGWTTGGPGAAAAGDTLSLTGTGTGTTYARQAVATVAGQRYWLSFGVDTATVLPGRLVGTTEGGDQIVPSATALAGSNARQFVATGPTTWIQFQRQTAGTAQVSGVRLEAVDRVGRSTNGTSQYFTLDVAAAGLRTANHTFYAGGWFRFNATSGGVYLLDFGNTFDTTGGGRVRLVAHLGSAAKVFCSTANADGTVYRENAVTTEVLVGEWYYAGVIAQANADVQLVWGATRPSAKTGAVPALSETAVCRRFSIGARYDTAPANMGPVSYSDWCWCSGSIPTTEQVQALAGGTRPAELAGFAPTYAWAMDHSGTYEPSLRAFANLGAAASPPVALDLATVQPTPQADVPLGIIII